MSAVISVASAVFWGLLVLSVLVFVHEGGHYLAARAFRVRATEFFLGLPCRWKLSRRSRAVGTEFGVTPFLLGGYTRICGMEGADDELLAPALDLVMERGRVRADEVARELGIDVGRAYDLLATLSDWASIRPYYDPTLGEKPGQSDWPAAFETLARDKDLLTEYDRGHALSAPGATAAGEPHPTGMPAEEFLEQERSRTYQGVGFVKRVCMLVAGPAVNVVLAFVIVTCALMVRGVDLYSTTATLGGVEAGSYAEAAGLEAGDVVSAVGDTEVSSWQEMSDALAPYLEDGQDFQITYQRDGQSHQTEVDLPDGQPVDLLGVTSSVVTYHPTLGEAAQATVSYVGQAGAYVAQLIQPAHTMEVLDQSSSIVGISAMAAQAAETGAYELAVLVGAVSLSLGFMNLLPIPPFDGGKVLIEVIQLVIRRPLSVRAQNALSYLGLAFIVFVFVVVLKNDVVRFVIG
ncbi:site-2 protease family protein [Olsenella profusa]|uniref:Site-2 protease family protein n=1 Tax=Olsenella profusa TaxID=138595 RepID=A0ABS2EZT6_9ACTN|nr:site-2 protease family protein [Olsenella profusa]MBM6774130.1 site-2 protease family protein [Olsenella profusa]